MNGLVGIVLGLDTAQDFGPMFRLIRHFTRQTLFTAIPNSRLVLLII